VGELGVAARAGGHAMVGERTLEALQGRLRGPLLLAGDAGYDEARTVFSALIDHRPALIARCWTDPVDNERNIAWTRELFAIWEPHLARAAYVNDLGDEGDDRGRSAYGDNYARLATLKAKYDPTNCFRLNQNIKPLA